jgi:hypothetical protein
LHEAAVSVFRIRFFTPSVLDDSGWPHAGGELQLGTDHIRFLVDLQHWGMKDYERQWQAAIARLVRGAPSTALMTAYRGPDADTPHLMYALWRDEQSVYAQVLSVHPTDLERPFDPAAPYDHVGQWIPATEHSLPIAEFSCDLLTLLAAHYFPNLRWGWAGGH